MLQCSGAAWREADVIRWRPSQELVVVVTYTVGLYMTVVDNTIIYTALPSWPATSTTPWTPRNG